MSDPVHQPNHYTWIPGIECIEVARHFPYPLGCAIKYIWRAGRKHADKQVEDLKKAREYLTREIEYLEGGAGASAAQLRALDDCAS